MSDETLKQLESELAALESTPATAPVQTAAESGAPTDDFNRCVLWHTWRYGSNGGEGDFKDWRITEGVRLTKLHDERLLAAIVKLQSPSGIAEWGEKNGAMMVRFLTSELSWNYRVPVQFRGHWHTFTIIKG